MTTKEDNAERMRQATIALARAHRPRASVGAPERRSHSSVASAFALVLALTLPIGAALTLRTRRPQPAVVTDARSFVHTSDEREHRSAGRFFVTAVTVPRLKGALLTQGKDGIQSAQRNASAAAFACLRIPPRDGHIRFQTNGHIGASGGLIYALQIVDAFDQRDITAGARVAGTGTISPTGEVGPILSIEVKARAAERAGVAVFLAPAEQANSARAGVRTVRVVGVHTLDEAIRALTGEQGCR